MKPTRGKLFVKHIQTADRLPGSLVILTSETLAQWTTCQMEVVALGDLAFCTDTDCERQHVWEFKARYRSAELGTSKCVHACPVKLGDWVFIRNRSLLETDVDGITCCHQDDVLAILASPNDSP